MLTSQKRKSSLNFQSCLIFFHISRLFFAFPLFRVFTSKLARSSSLYYQAKTNWVRSKIVIWKRWQKSGPCFDATALMAKVGTPLFPQWFLYPSEITKKTVVTSILCLISVITEMGKDLMITLLLLSMARVEILLPYFTNFPRLSLLSPLPLVYF